MAFTPEMQSRIAELRARATAGTLTIEEMREAILLLRRDRVSAASASEAAQRKKAKAAIPNAQSLLDELANL